MKARSDNNVETIDTNNCVLKYTYLYIKVTH